MTARAAAGLGVLVAVPLVLWHDMLGAVLSAFRFNLTYLSTELGPWLLFIAAIGFLIPVAISDGRPPDTRLYPHLQRACIGWASVLYILACILAVEVTDLWSYLP